MIITDTNKSFLELKSKVKNFDKVAPFDCVFTIEAYPRSANSFVTSTLIPLLRKSDEISTVGEIIHHTHRVDTILFSIANDIPTLSIIRNPLDAISSAFIYYSGKRPLNSLIASWISFYDPILDLYKQNNAGGLLLVDFDLVISSPNMVINRINDIFKLNLELLVDERESEKKIFKGAMARAITFHGVDNYKSKVGIPVKGRDVEKNAIKDILVKEKGSFQTKKLYEELLCFVTRS